MEDSRQRKKRRTSRNLSKTLQGYKNASKNSRMMVLRVTGALTCREVNVTGYLLAPLQDRREVRDTQTQWAHFRVICRHACTVELLIHWRLHRWCDDNAFRLHAHIGRKYVSFQWFL